MQKNKIEGESLKDQLREASRDRLYHFLLAGDRVRGLALNGTRMIKEMRRNHELGVLETLVLGHAYLGATLMAGQLKGNDRLSLGVDCSGPIKGLTVEANAYGEVRGYLKNVPIPVAKDLESFNLSPFFGAGFLSVTKYLDNAKHPFTGQVMLEKGNLAEDLVLYHLKSEQIATSISLSVVFDRGGAVEGAGGLMLQALPGAEQWVLSDLERRVLQLSSLGRVVQQTEFPETWLRRTFGDLQPRLVNQRSVAFMCHCSRDKIQSMLTLLPVADLQEMAENGPFPIRILCHHCNTAYSFEKLELAVLSAGNAPIQ